jgi:hypothetical protein
MRINGWRIAGLAVVLAVAAIPVLLHLRSREAISTRRLLERIPNAGESPLVSIDAAMLRRAGILNAIAGSRAVEDSEYKAFVAATAFNYRDHLDSVLAAFQGDHTYMFIRGRFDWPALRKYVQAQGGSCEEGYCRMAGSRPERQISFFPLREKVMALAVSPSDRAATHLMEVRGPVNLEIPAQPVWVSVPAVVFKKTALLPPGTHLFAKALEDAERAVFALDRSGSRYEAVMRVTCRSSDDATVLLAQMERITDVLKKLISRTNQKPNPKDLSGVLTAGSFRREDRRVLGRWPIEQPFLESLAGGTL